MKRGILMEEEVRTVKRKIAVYLVGRDLVEAAMPYLRQASIRIVVPWILVSRKMSGFTMERST